jgi:tryptophan-rich sensory protein
MRPDTEPNQHAKRIMAGAFALFVVAVITFAWEWLLAHSSTLAVGVAIVGIAGVFCYVLGYIVLGFWEMSEFGA